MNTAKYVSPEKRSKKEKQRYYAAKRGDWNGIKPVTRVIPDRKKQKLIRQKELECRDMD